MKRQVFALVMLVVVFTSCKKEEAAPEPPVDTAANGLIICNEGNFNWGNASLTFYNFDTETVSNNVFQSANEENLGDVCQSAAVVNDKLYVVVNNSAKIEVLNSNNFERMATISGFTSPRYIQQVSSSKAYVSDLYAHKVWIVDLDNHVITGNIPLAGWTEEMTLVDDRVFVTNVEKRFTYVVDVNTDEIVDSVEVGTGAGSIQLDNNGAIWLTRSGDENINELPALVEVKEGSVSYHFMEAEATPSKLVYDGVKNALYFLNGDVCRFDIATKIMDAKFIAANNRIFYGLGVDAEANQLYVSDVKDFVQASTVYIYGADGSQQGTFDAGINAGWFLKPNK